MTYNEALLELENIKDPTLKKLLRKAMPALRAWEVVGLGFTVEEADAILAAYDAGDWKLHDKLRKAAFDRQDAIRNNPNYFKLLKKEE